MLIFAYTPAQSQQVFSCSVRRSSCRYKENLLDMVAVMISESDEFIEVCFFHEKEKAAARLIMFYVLTC